MYEKHLIKPTTYIWTATAHRVTLDLTLSPHWEISALFPISPINTIASDQGVCQNMAWKVFARASGLMLDEETGLQLSSLSWETRVRAAPVTSDLVPIANEFNPSNATLRDSDSVLLRVTDIISYLNSCLRALGLQAEARTLFIQYFLPAFVRNEYVALRFIPQEEYGRAAKLQINPAPDIIVRMFMIFRGVSSDELDTWKMARAQAEEPVSRWREVIGLPKDDQLKQTDRFRVLEWGGMEVLV
ncbi:hypothetical protein BXZ70DRAFT_889929 [Cristinia sonorae]|uniref:Uncharacterized protein n=1 Tax=Cristinia sonorae TaxID=1940300 RepID=A0A8K0UTE9_9AGAR|nr:hypothetical protein BXZ70DRAFT_889929 [Cristinia sonorae]